MRLWQAQQEYIQETQEFIRRHLADYYACITCLDYHLGRIFDCLRDLGQWTNTVVIFAGDNGLSLGEHGLMGKQNLYEYGGMHVPLVFAGPGIRHGRAASGRYRFREANMILKSINWLPPSDSNRTCRPSKISPD